LLSQSDHTSTNHRAWVNGRGAILVDVSWMCWRNGASFFKPAPVVVSLFRQQGSHSLSCHAWHFMKRGYADERGKGIHVLMRNYCVIGGEEGSVDVTLTQRVGKRRK